MHDPENSEITHCPQKEYNQGYGEVLLVRRGMENGKGKKYKRYQSQIIVACGIG
jgi:hypothetical protein